MFRGVKMLCGVFVFGGVAAAYVAAPQTKAQVHPVVAHLQALFAALGLWFHAFNLIKVRTIVGHIHLPRNYRAV